MSLRWSQARLAGAEQQAETDQFREVSSEHVTVKVTECCNRLHKDVVESHSLKILRTHLDKILCCALGNTT